MSELDELREKVRIKREKEKLEAEKKKLEQELEEGTIKDKAKKGFKKFLKRMI